VVEQGDLLVGLDRAGGELGHLLLTARRAHRETVCTDRLDVRGPLVEAGDIVSCVGHVGGDRRPVGAGSDHGDALL
jgi:hypothetical protein